MDDVKRILVVSRSTRGCRKAVHYGVSLAKKYGSELCILHVIHDPFGYDSWDLPTLLLYIQPTQAEYKKLQQKARAEIDEILNLERTKGILIKELVKEGKPVEEILRVVEEEKIDLIVMLGHKEGRLEHLLFCRDVESLIRKMPCSVMLVKEDLH